MIRRISLFMIAFWMVPASLIAVIPLDDANAVSGTCYFNTLTGPVAGVSGCSESGLGDYGTNDIFTGRDSFGNGLAIGTSVNNKTDFVNYILNRFNNGNDHNRIGAAFVIQELRGSRAWPTNANRDNWVQRMSNPDVTFHRGAAEQNQRITSSSWYDDDKKNVFYDSYTAYRDVIRLKYKGSTIFTIEVGCGNLVAGTIPPPDEFTLSGTSDAVPDNVAPNNIVALTGISAVTSNAQFVHRVTNNGPGNMGKPLDAFAEWNGGNYYTATRWNCDRAAGLNDGAVQTSCTNTFSIPANATPGNNYCQRVVYTPYRTAGGTGASTTSCARVVQYWSGAPKSALISPAPDAGAPNVPYRFEHEVTNNGKSSLRNAGSGAPNATVEAQLQESVDGGSYQNIGSATTLPNLSPGFTSPDIVSTGTLPSDFGLNGASSSYCQRLTITPGSAVHTTDGAVRSSSPKCISVQPNYELIPTTSVTPGGHVEEGTDINVTPLMENQGPTASPSSAWELVQFTLAPNVNHSSLGNYSQGAGVPCGYYSNGCTVMSQGAGVFDKGDPADYTSTSGANFIPNNFTVPANAPLGTKYCFALAVNPYTQTSTDWRYGRAVCITIAIKPRIQVWGHDMHVLGKIVTSTSQLGSPSKTFGSFGEYGVLSDEENFGMGSGSKMLDGAASSSQDQWSPLTFANTVVGSLPQFGNYHGLVHPTVASTGATELTGPQQFPADLPGGFGATFGSGDKLVVKVNGLLRITSNLVYANGPYSSIRNLPRIVIIADDVVIDANVTTIDPWIVANRISTCRDVNDGASNFFVAPDDVSLSATSCNQPLRFNGPVIADSIYLYRTTNSGNSTNTAAEIFNLRADSFLSAYAGGGSTNPVATTDTITELPPRF